MANKLFGVNGCHGFLGGGSRAAARAVLFHPMSAARKRGCDGIAHMIFMLEEGEEIALCFCPQQEAPGGRVEEEF